MRFGAAFWVNRTTWPDLLAATPAVAPELLAECEAYLRDQPAEA